MAEPAGQSNAPATSTASSGRGSSPHGVKPVVRTISDEQLVRDHLAGDSKSFGELVQRYQRELYHFLARFTGDSALADDVFQETFIQVHAAINQFDLTRRFKPWLFTIASNKARDALRSRARQGLTGIASQADEDGDGKQIVDLLSVDYSLPSQPLEAEEQRERVRQVVLNLPENLKQILLLAYFHQHPYKDIAEMLDIPLGTVKSRLHSAIATFAQKWKAINSPAARANLKGLKA